MWDSTTLIAAALLSGGLIVGCATIPRQAGFTAVAETVESRTGWRLQQYAGTPPMLAIDVIQDLLRQDLTLDRAVRIALLNNRSLQATFEDLGVARADVMQAGLLKNPIFSGHVRFPRTSGPTDVEFAVAQAVLDTFFIPLRKKVAAAQFERAKLRVTDAVLALIAEVKTACYTAQAAEQVHALRQITLQAGQAASELAQRQYEAGNIRDFDLANEQAVYHQAQAELARIQAELTEAREALNRLLGLSAAQTTAWRMATALPALPPADPARDDLEALAISQRLDLAAARKDVEVLRRTLGLTRIGPFATPEAGVSTETEEGIRVTGPHWVWAVPLFDWGQADRSRAKAQLRQLEHQLAALEVAARSEVRLAADHLMAQRQLVETYQDHIVPLREQAVTSSQRHYNYMLIGVFQLLQLKQQAIEAQQASIEALRDYWITQAALERAVGGALPAADLSAKTSPPPRGQPASPVGQVPETPHEHHHGGGP